VIWTGPVASRRTRWPRPSSRKARISPRDPSTGDIWRDRPKAGTARRSLLGRGKPAQHCGPATASSSGSTCRALSCASAAPRQRHYAWHATGEIAIHGLRVSNVRVLSDFINGNLAARPRLAARCRTSFSATDNAAHGHRRGRLDGLLRGYRLHQLRQGAHHGTGSPQNVVTDAGPTSSSHISTRRRGSVYYSYTNGESGFGPFDRLAKVTTLNRQPVVVRRRPRWVTSRTWSPTIATSTGSTSAARAASCACASSPLRCFPARDPSGPGAIAKQRLVELALCRAVATCAFWSFARRSLVVARATHRSSSRRRGGARFGRARTSSPAQTRRNVSAILRLGRPRSAAALRDQPRHGGVGAFPITPVTAAARNEVDSSLNEKCICGRDRRAACSLVQRSPGLVLAMNTATGLSLATRAVGRSRPCGLSSATTTPLPRSRVRDVQFARWRFVSGARAHGNR